MSVEFQWLKQFITGDITGQKIQEVFFYPF